jgi:hypothetical protein
VRNILIVFYLFFIITTAYPAFSAQAQEVQSNPAGAAAQTQPEQLTQPAQVPLPGISPTPRSKLEIIQYILLPFAIGASIWLILRLEKMEQEEAKENKGK